MKTLKIEDESNGCLEVSMGNICIDDIEDAPGVIIGAKWDG
ncbi:MAG: hypothetical protein ACHQF4_02435 [Sphingobacteriales bacterium]|jgi:hypothetical protein